MPADTVCAAFQETAAQRADEVALRTKDGETEITWAEYADKVRRTAFTAHEIEPWEFDVLAALRRAGAPYQLTPGALLRQTMVTSGTMTNRVDQLVKR